jgi:hypothetical protein
VIEGHLNATLNRKRVSVLFAEAGSFIFGKVGEPADAKGTNRLFAIIKDEMRGLVVIPVEDKGGRDTVFMDKADASQDHCIPDVIRGGCYLASKIGIFVHHRSAPLSAQPTSTPERVLREGRRFQGGFQK